MFFTSVETEKYIFTKADATAAPNLRGLCFEPELPLRIHNNGSHSVL